MMRFGPGPRAVDLGHDHWYSFFVWAPDDLPANREWLGLGPDDPMPVVDPSGCTVWHRRADNGLWCRGAVTFDVPGLPESEQPRWTLVGPDPLHVEPSVLCRQCGDHGHVHGGRWVPA